MRLQAAGSGLIGLERMALRWGLSLDSGSGLNGLEMVRGGKG